MVMMRMTIIIKAKTDRTIHNNKADTIIHDNEKGSCMLIDTEVSAD
jgi:hypothetical protein